MPAWFTPCEAQTPHPVPVARVVAVTAPSGPPRLRASPARPRDSGASEAPLRETLSDRGGPFQRENPPPERPMFPAMDEPGGAPTATLLVCCPDRRGIVAALAQTLYGHGANILEADQHTDRVAGVFFQRIHFDLAELHTDRSALEHAIREVAERLGMRWQLAYADRLERVAIFVSRTDHCLWDLLLRHQAGELRCEIPLIVSNHPDHRRVAEQFGIPYHVFAMGPGDPGEVEQKQLALLAEHGIDLVVLARYMRILSGAFLDRFGRPVINIHHSFLPAFSGGRPYHQAYERGVKLIGATAHYATRDLDEGPIIEQDVIRASHRHSVEELVRAGRDVERTVLSRAVRWHLEHRVLVHGNRTVVFA
jgi:formyltetrahydrofolate deformylase